MEIMVSLYIFIVIILVGIGLKWFIKYRKEKNRLMPSQDVVVLYQLGRGPRAPSISPFPLKLETFLRMMKLPYMNDHTAQFSTKGKSPWMEINGQATADSQLCIEALKDRFHVDANSHLTDEQTAAGRAFLKLTEENLYWTMCIETFGDGSNEVYSIIPYTGLKLWVTVFALRKMIKLETWGHGIGRHTSDEVWQIAKQDMDAISHFLGNKPYFLGDRPSEIDCAMFSMVAMIYWHMPNSKHEAYLKDKLPNLVSYVLRMKERYWPDWDEVTLEGANYSSDHGKQYFQENLRDHNNDYKTD